MTLQKKAGELSMTDRFDGVKSVPSITTNQASTPRPWTVDAMGYIRGPNSENILENHDNAEFICDVVDQHAALKRSNAELIKKLRTASIMLESIANLPEVASMGGLKTNCNWLSVEIDEAIAKAEGK